MTAHRYDVVAVGGGPANLSLAALYGTAAGRPMPVLERASGPGWHPGLLLPGARLQTSWVKDLVSLVDPRHELGFLNYIVSTGRIYAFLNAQFDAIPRLEYARYLRWAADRLDVRYGTGVEEVSYDGEFLAWSAGQVVARTRHLVLGLGTVAHVPPCFGGRGTPGVLLAEQLAGRLDELDRHRADPVIVVGGGQTGAECVLVLLQRGFSDVQWIGRRHWFAPLDDSPSANDLFRPSYARFFQGLPAAVRETLLRDQVLTSDGVSMSSLQEIYQTQYEGFLREGRSPLILLPGREVVAVRSRGGVISMRCRLSTGGQEFRETRHVVLATGRRPTPLPLAPGLAELIETDRTGQPVVEDDYRLRWKHGDQNRIYLQNRSRLTHGVNDPNLSLLSVRAALIVNSLLDRDAYTIVDEQNFTYWPTAHFDEQEGRTRGL
ncbi:lysine N(6)-hydroxylase/L-ornithine N(5)-oxygenase family protein [Micromonospora rosaria]|uniref:lysine N(6)-hydroxylase/L-ornithine N(5)-oxygenase family protein n=1 Tax=Micromonospora rosaria TaxID=47874 RepID=UPI000837032C|nr:SidA/IucD/PvdA family monooxygenase [Micromonospora rosaria]